MSDYLSRSDYVIGEKASLSRTIIESDLTQMADLTGDHNPIHMDESFASRSRFKGRIAHGLFSVGLISAVLGTRLPGPGAIYLKQTLDFLAPVRVGDTLTAEVEVISWQADKRIMKLKTICYLQGGKQVLSGEAILLVDQYEGGISLLTG